MKKVMNMHERKTKIRFYECKVKNINALNEIMRENIYFLKVNLQGKWDNDLILLFVKKIQILENAILQKIVLFTLFWKDMSWGERRTYVASLCHFIEPKVNKTGTKILDDLVP